MSDRNKTNMKRLILSLVMSDLAVASLVNSIAEKIDGMSFEEDRSLEALGDLKELVSDVLFHCSQREPVRYEILSSLLSDAGYEQDTHQHDP